MRAAAGLARVLVALLVCLSPGLAAQDAPPAPAPAPAPGTRVRVVAPTVARDPVIGTIRASGTDTLVLDIADRSSPVAIPVAALETFEVSGGRHSHTWQGAGVGLLIGAAVGAAAGSSCEGDFLCPGPAGGALVLGIVGVIPGAVIGALIRSERWENVSLDAVTVTTGPSRRGLGLAVSLRF